LLERMTSRFIDHVMEFISASLIFRVGNIEHPGGTFPLT
jgi:hypothetical protein